MRSVANERKKKMDDFFAQRMGFQSFWHMCWFREKWLMNNRDIMTTMQGLNDLSDELIFQQVM